MLASLWLLYYKLQTMKMMMIYCNLLRILSRIIIFTAAFHLAQVLSQAQIDMFCCNFSCSMHASSPLSLLVVSSPCCPGGGGGARGTKPCVVKFQNLQFGVRQGTWEWGEPAEFDHPVCLCMDVIILYWMLNLGWSKSHVLSRKSGLWKASFSWIWASDLKPTLLCLWGEEGSAVM